MVGVKKRRKWKDKPLPNHMVILFFPVKMWIYEMRCRLVNHVIAIPCIHFLLFLLLLIYQFQKNCSMIELSSDECLLVFVLYASSTCSSCNLLMNLHLLILSFRLSFFVSGYMMEASLKICVIHVYVMLRWKITWVQSTIWVFWNVETSFRCIYEEFENSIEF